MIAACCGPANAGAGAPYDAALWQRVADYGIEVRATGYVVDKPAQTQAIIAAVPAGATVDMSDWPNSVTVQLPAGHSGGSSFVLNIHHP